VAGAVGDLFAAAQELLAAAAVALEDAPAGPITRKLISQSAPVFDCAPQLSVHAGGPSIADTYPLQPPLQPMQRIVTAGLVDLVVMTITVTRCVSTLGEEGQDILLPTPEALTADSEACYGDLWAIWNHLVKEHREGNLFQSLSKRREFALEPAQPLNNGGGVGGWEIPVRFQLPGYGGGPS
jgi:hypothetical protein